MVDISEMKASIRDRIKISSNDRIVYYYYKADSIYWDNVWQETITHDYYKKYEQGDLDEFSTIFLKYLRKENRILEAGCGNGRYVLALQSRGFLGTEGIEWGQKTVKLVKDRYPNLPIRTGDVTNLDVQDEYYDDYISLGVVEHRIDGPSPFLNEAFRVMKRGGYAIFVLPYINPCRKLKQTLGFYNRSVPREFDFYQYAFSKKEFSEFLTKAGFTIVETKGLAGYYGMKEELPALFLFLSKLHGGWRIAQLIKNSSLIKLFSHTNCYVCQKL